MIDKPKPAATGFDSLSELALDLRWSWSHASDVIWKRLDPEMWETTQNPWAVLCNASPARVSELLAEPQFGKHVQDMLNKRRQAEHSPLWFQKAHPAASVGTIAYFSMEFMLSEALPIYSGGLGNVAADQLKTASDLGVPVVGIGLLYSQGYFRQSITIDGYQEALYPFNDPGQMPVRPLRTVDGEWLRLPIHLPGHILWLRAWEVVVGRTRLYLLDTNDPANLPVHRCITSELYGGGPELRLKQEIILGIGGWRLLRAIGLDPEVCHLNEGHAAFAVLERAKCFQETNNVSFEAALTITRAGNIFTTHTAVEAGFDRFAPVLMEKYLKTYAETSLHIPLDDLMALGRQNAADPSEPFNMAYLAIRGSGTVSAVSALHEKVSQKLFQPLFPRWPESEVPIGHVTNGVHVPTWDSAQADQIWTEAAGKERWLDDLKGIEDNIRQLTDTRLWDFRSDARQSLVNQVRKEYERQLAEHGETPSDVAANSQIFDAGALTLGFARRFATYKRPNLLLHDPDRLVRILTNKDRPVQLMLAGKAHPQDIAGQALIKQWIDFSRRLEVRAHIMFLCDYDMLQAQRLVQGCDVWVNTPLRPWEACGTSGMKVLVNGGLNLSELDGWWAEAYTPDVGWAIGDGKEHDASPALDEADANALYGLLENSIIPEFYDRNTKDIPVRWVSRIRESMAALTPQFSANRAVREYTEKFYLPAAANYVERAAAGEHNGLDMSQWRDDLRRLWPHIHFGSGSVASTADENCISVQIYLGDLDPDAIKVELYAGGEAGGSAIIESMTRECSLAGPGGGYSYVATVSSARSAADYTARVIPSHRLVSIPLEENLVLWQH